MRARLPQGWRRGRAGPWRVTEPLTAPQTHKSWSHWDTETRSTARTHTRAQAPHAPTFTHSYSLLSHSSLSPLSLLSSLSSLSLLSLFSLVISLLCSLSFLLPIPFLSVAILSEAGTVCWGPGLSPLCSSAVLDKLRSARDTFAIFCTARCSLEDGDDSFFQRGTNVELDGTIVRGKVQQKPPAQTRRRTRFSPTQPCPATASPSSEGESLFAKGHLDKAIYDSGGVRAR